QLHGHSYRVDVHITGTVDPRTGWVIDFGVIKHAVEPIISQLDHRCLNEIPGLENSTSEMLCKYLWDRLKPELDDLSAVTIWESSTARCTYQGE
ncbi:MAG: 6-carboxytetrahydropterin synthase, partial [Planctomycetaceae bacterium]